MLGFPSLKIARKLERNVESKVANKNVRKSQRKTTQRKIDQVAAEKEGSKVDATATCNQCAEPPRRRDDLGGFGRRRDGDLDRQTAAPRVERGQRVGAEPEDGHALRLEDLERER